MALRAGGLLGGIALVAQLLVAFVQAPTAIAAVPVAAQISSGWGHTCAIADADSMRCWGTNDHGELANGEAEVLTPNPVPGETLPALNEIDSVGSGLAHSCAVVQGDVRCWGWNGYGQLGTGDTDDRLTASATVVTSGDVAKVVTGSAHSCALLDSGGVQCWGNNEVGELGNGKQGCPADPDPCKSTTPVTVSGLSGVTDIATAVDHTCVVAGGAVKCWGPNWTGQLGNGSTAPYESTPVAATGLGSGVKAVDVGSDHSCAVTGAGALKCWGDNEFGQIGDGTSTERHTPVVVAQAGTAQVALGWQHSCLLTTKDGVACWGRNTFGGVGDGTTKKRERPVAVSGLGIGSGVVEVTGGYQFTCARLVDDQVMCWGRNDFGQLGDGTTTSRTKPVITLFDCIGEAPTLVSSPNEPTIGTPGDDVIVGTNGPDIISGEGGFDRICGFGGGDAIVVGDLSARVRGGPGGDEIVGGDDRDKLIGNGGNDSISGGGAEDEIDGSKGDDELRGDDGPDVMWGGAGVDSVLGGGGDDIMRGHEGPDILNGGADNDTLHGHEGDDVVVGGAGFDTADGGEGEDVITGGGAADWLVGGTGTDRISGNGDKDELYGNDQDDLLFGGAAGDSLYGQAGDDRLTGDGGRDLLRGGPGIDHDNGGGDGDTCWGETFEQCADRHNPG